MTKRKIKEFMGTIWKDHVNMHNQICATTLAEDAANELEDIAATEQYFEASHELSVNLEKGGHIQSIS